MRIVLAILLPCLAWAQLTVRPLEPSQAYRAGDVAPSLLVLTDATWFNRLTTARLRAFQVDENLWVQSVEPWQAKDGAFTARAKLVLGAKLDMARPWTTDWGGETLVWRFEGWNFVPGGSSKEELEFVATALGARWRWPTWGNWVLATLGMASLVLGALLPGWWRRRRTRRAIEGHRQTWLKRIESVRDLTGASRLWAERDALLAAWPEEEGAIRECFEVLNRHQFRPRPDDEGVREVLAATSLLHRRLSGRRDGV